jgi:hypothetical protein
MTEMDRQRKQEEIQEMQHTAEVIQNEERMHADEQHTIYEEELAEGSRYQRQTSKKDRKNKVRTGEPLGKIRPREKGKDEKL